MPSLRWTMELVGLKPIVALYGRCLFLFNLVVAHMLQAFLNRNPFYRRYRLPELAVHVLLFSVDCCVESQVVQGDFETR